MLLKKSKAVAANEIELASLKSEFAALSAYRDQLIHARAVTGSKDTEKWRRAEQITVTRVTNFSRLFNFYSIGAWWVWRGISFLRNSSAILSRDP